MLYFYACTILVYSIAKLIFYMKIKNVYMYMVNNECKDVEHFLNPHYKFIYFLNFYIHKLFLMKFSNLYQLWWLLNKMDLW